MANLGIFVDMLFNAFTHTALLVFVAGFLYRLYEFKNTPQPLKIPQTPQATTASGVFARMAGDVLIFRSLSKGTKVLWITGWVFHFTFLILILRHLRYFVYPVPGWIVSLGDIALPLGVLMLIALIVLTLRRFTNERVAFVTNPADYFALLLIIGITVTGIMMKFEPFRPDIVAVKAFFYELFTLHGMFGALIFHPVHVPANLVFLTHLFLVLTLLVYFPFSKLMHAGGYFFSPTRNMVNNPRDVRHINPWDTATEEGNNG